jgi:16S rRNA processing protein RimM
MAPRTNLPVGVLGRPHGLRGEILLHPFHRGGLRMDRLGLPLQVEIELKGRLRPAELRAARGAGADTLLAFRGVETREAAAALTHAVLHVPRASLPPLCEGEFYVQDLVGCSVVDGAGRARGVVRGAFWNGAHDVLSVVPERGDGGARDDEEWLVPVVPAFVLEVDVEARRLVLADHEPDGEAEAGPGSDVDAEPGGGSA